MKSHNLSFSVQSGQETELYRSKNTDVLISHLENLGELYVTFKVYPTRDFNLVRQAFMWTFRGGTC